MKTVVVTGASGFIGQSLCSNLLAQGYQVVGVCRSHPKVRGVIHAKLSLGESILPVLNQYLPLAIIHGANSTPTGVQSCVWKKKSNVKSNGF